MGEVKVKHYLNNYKNKETPYKPALEDLEKYKREQTERWLFLETNCPRLSAWIEREAAEEMARLEGNGTADVNSQEEPGTIRGAPPFIRIKVVNLCSRAELKIIEAAQCLKEKEQTLISLEAYGHEKPELLAAMKELYPALIGCLEGTETEVPKEVEIEALEELERLVKDPAPRQPLQSLADFLAEDYRAPSSIQKRYPGLTSCLEAAAETKVEKDALERLEKVARDKSVNSDMMLIDILRDSRRNIYANHSSDCYRRIPSFWS